MFMNNDWPFIITCSHYAAATLKLSQPDNEDRKARALEAAVKELDRLFRKEDFSRMKVSLISSYFLYIFYLMQLKLSVAVI